jgi:hypothetical protein
MSEKTFLTQKIYVMRTVKKFKMYALMTREPEEISQKCQRIWIQQAKSIFSVEK